MVYSLVIFDWEGTLVDSTYRTFAAIQAACRDLELPLPASDAFPSWARQGFLTQGLQQLVPTLTAAALPCFLERYQLHYVLDEAVVKLFPGVRQMLADLAARHIRLAVATNNARVRLTQALAATALSDVFQATRCADETFSKPNPTMLYEILDALDVPAEQAVMVGDTPQDLQMAACAHIDSVGVTYGDTACPTLRAYHPQAVCQSVAELQRWLLPA